MFLTFRDCLPLGEYLVFTQKFCIITNTFRIFSSESSFFGDETNGGNELDAISEHI